MIAILRFNLANPEQQREYIHAMEGGNYYRFIHDIKEALIQADKYGAVQGVKEINEQQHDMIARARELFMELYSESGLREVDV